MKFLIALVLSLLITHVCSADTLRPRDFRMPGVATAAFSHAGIAYEPGSTTMTIIGQIDFDLYWDFKKLLKAHPEIRTVYIDSGGGAAASAMLMADLVHDRRLKLIVEGLCASACAQFLLPAAVEKRVEPGSIVAIHTGGWAADGDRSIMLATGNETTSVLWSNATKRIFEPGTLKRFKEIWLHYDVERSEKDFQRKYHVNPMFVDAFGAYLTRRKKLLGTEDVASRPGSADCPRIAVWVLDKAQLESAGVRGFDAFWFPEDKDEQRRQDRAFQQVPGALFFGTREQLDRYCLGTASTQRS
jgi:ATP-dependent protease ClpP protease subunit